MEGEKGLRSKCWRAMDHDPGAGHDLVQNACSLLATLLYFLNRKFTCYKRAKERPCQLFRYSNLVQVQIRPGCEHCAPTELHACCKLNGWQQGRAVLLDAHGQLSLGLLPEARGRSATQNVPQAHIGFGKRLVGNRCAAAHSDACQHLPPQPGMGYGSREIKRHSLGLSQVKCQPAFAQLASDANDVQAF